jgi:hypothetical protein
VSTPRIIVQAQEFVTRVVARGLRGERGQGVIPGGLQGQILGKRSDDDYDTEWLNPGDAPSLVNSVTATAPITSTGGVNPVVGITPATPTQPGSMSAGDKAKLDNILLSSAPPAVGASSQAGTSDRAARQDHTHAHGSQAGGTLHAVAVGGPGGSAGFMSAADKNKLDSIAAGAQVNVGTNLGIGGTGNARTVTSSTGASATLPIATTAAAGVMSVEDKAKLDGISPGATVYTNALARGQVEAMLVAGANITLTYSGIGASRTVTISASGTGGGGSGTVTSVQASGGSTGLTFSGGPVTTSGTLTLSGTLGIGNGGTGATTAEAARAALGAGTGNGTVTSVALSLPGIFSLSGSPVTAAGTITAALAAQAANAVWAGPTTGADAAPTFRALTATDIPGLPVSQIRNLQEQRLFGTSEFVDSLGSGQTIELGTGFVWGAGTIDLSENLLGWHALAPSSKQDTITPGTGLSFSGATLNLSANLQGWHAIAPSAKQDALTAGSGIDITGNVISATGVGGLTNWAEAVSTSAPNATVPAVSFTVNNAATNADAVVASKGNGARIANIPDNATSGGNKRGTRAVDWQSQRTSATQVASGANAVISGGNGNTAAGQQAVVGGGGSNSASGANSTVPGGVSNIASATQSTVGGGWTNQASGVLSTISGGFANQATGERSWIPGGAVASTRGLYGAHAWSSTLRGSVNGDNQHFGMTMQGTTTNATATIITADRGSPSATNVNVLPNNSVWFGLVWVGARSAGGDTANWLVSVKAKRGANAASTTVVRAEVIDSDIEAGLSGVALSIVANTTRGSVEPQFTGLASTTIDVFCEFFGGQIAR